MARVAFDKLRPTLVKNNAARWTGVTLSPSKRDATHELATRLRL